MKVEVFSDWAGEQIRYRFRATKQDEGSPGEWVTCELDPHGLDQWAPWGRGRTSWAALQRAKEAWKLYDRT